MSGFQLESLSLMTTFPIMTTISRSMPINESLKELSTVYVCRSKKLNHSDKVLQRYPGSRIAQD